jgi:hypothetical protein
MLGVVVASAWSWRDGFVGGVRVSGGAVREGVVLGGAPGESLPGFYRPTVSASADVVSPPWRRRRGVHPLHILGFSSSGESLRPGWVGRRRRHRRFPLWGVALKSFGSRLRASWAGRSRHCGRLVSVRQCGCCAASCLWQRWRLRAESGLLMVLGSRSLPACSRSRRSGAGSAQAQRFSPAMLVDRVGAAWSPARVADCLASAGASLDACLR